MGNIKTATDLHRESEEAREQDRHTDALKLIEEAMVLYQQEKDYGGFVMALQSRVLIYKHLHYLTEDTVFAILAQKDAEASLVIAEEYKLFKELSSCYFRLGETAMLFENYKNAVENYRKAMTFYQGEGSEKGDYRYHLGEALYKSGKKVEGKRMILEGLREIKSLAKGTDTFLEHVWESGCYMRLAELLRTDLPDEAKRYLKKAWKIAEGDDKLVIRRRQLVEVAKKFPG